MSKLDPVTFSHKKGKHLSYEERVIIQLRLKDKHSIRNIARGSVALYHGHETRWVQKHGMIASC